MLTQLANLSLAADGRYASDRELQFLKNYLQSVDRRIDIYDKIRDHSEQIIEKVRECKDDRNQTGERIGYTGSNDRSSVCLRDMTGVLRCSAAMILIDDLDRMRQAILLWYYTIVSAFNYQNDTHIMYQFLENVVNSYLTEEEIELAKPFLQLNYTILK